MLLYSSGKGEVIMNILLVTPIYSAHYDAGWFWLRAFQKLGHTVTIWDYRLDSKPPPIIHYPDLVLVLKGESIDPRRLPSPRFCYWPDAFERDPGVEERLRGYDKVFTSNRPTPEWMIWLPTGWDPVIHRNLELKREVSSVYVGTANSEYKIKMISEIRPNHIRGNGWGRDISGPAIYLHELVSYLNQMRVLIDVHQSPRAGLNRKLFEMIACGFTLVDRVPGVEEILGLRLADQVSFRTPERARELIQYFLYHPSSGREDLWRREREQIAKHTYESAVEAVLDLVK